MKTNIKIALLTIAIIACLGGVLLFAQYIMNPPSDLSLVNCQRKAIEDKIESITATKACVLTDSTVDYIVDRLNVFQKEKFLTQKDCDEISKKFVDKYLPAFISQTDTLFNTQWDVDDLPAIVKRYGILTDIKVDGKQVVPIEKLSRITAIVSNCKRATKLIDTHSFPGVQEATSICNESRTLMEADGVKNCPGLIAKLQGVPTNLSDLHYKYLAKLVSSLHHRSGNVDNVLNAISEYQGMADVYGSLNDTGSLEAKCNEYNAPRYTESKPEYVEPERRHHETKEPDEPEEPNIDPGLWD